VRRRGERHRGVCGLGWQSHRPLEQRPSWYCVVCFRRARVFVCLHGVVLCLGRGTRTAWTRARARRATPRTTRRTRTRTTTSRTRTRRRCGAAGPRWESGRALSWRRCLLHDCGHRPSDPLPAGGVALASCVDSPPQDGGLLGGRHRLGGGSDGELADELQMQRLRGAAGGEGGKGGGGGAREGREGYGQPKQAAVGWS
jgi:hypothetical protein